MLNMLEAAGPKSGSAAETSPLVNPPTHVGQRQRESPSTFADQACCGLGGGSLTLVELRQKS